MKFAAIASLAVMATLAFPSKSQAAETYRYDVRSAADICRPARSIYDGKIRTKPLGVVNESSSVAWVTCALTGDMVGNTTVIELVFTTPGNEPRTCTLVSWRATNTGIGAIGYQPGSTVVVSGWDTRIRWTSANHNGGARYASTAISCPLEPGDGIVHVKHMYYEDIGQ
ncbi:hypothetical protein [Luteimonas arsenica]|uniref:hypothetical protein n=1 Tax=Luteimonas arsenica TaxID=1586242 RepID=UPI0010554EC0|nr:hypothetical protein [Luteimonas arsenica]